MESIMKETEFRIETFRYNNFFFKHKKRWKNGFLNSWLQERQLLPVILRVHLCILVCKDLFFIILIKIGLDPQSSWGWQLLWILDKRFRGWQIPWIPAWVGKNKEKKHWYPVQMRIPGSISFQIERNRIHS